MPESDATQLLRRLRDGDESAGDELAPLVYDELRRLAEHAMARVRPGHTLQPTALVNEAWLRLFQPDDAAFRGRGHFLAVAARAMRSILVDHARRRGALKRGKGERRLELDQVLLLFEERAVDLLALDEALEELAELDPPLAELVELRFYGGLSHPEIAAAQGRSLRTVERAWRTARAWLLRRVGEGDA